MQGLEMAGESSMKSYTYLKRRKKKERSKNIYMNLAILHLILILIE
jgi:hypothetical protein